jgi:hypothetical protein
LTDVSVPLLAITGESTLAPHANTIQQSCGKQQLGFILFCGCDKYFTGFYQKTTK